MFVSRLRLLFARRPWLHWLIAGLCAVLVWWQLASAQSGLDRARAAWGRTRTVWVATTSARAGDELVVAKREYPSAMTPAAAADTVPVTPVAAREVAAGAVLVQADIVGPNTTPAGWAVFAVRAENAPHLSAAVAVGVYADGQHLCDGRAADSTGEHVEIAVPPDCAPPLSDRLANGRVVVSRVSG